MILVDIFDYQILLLHRYFIQHPSFTNDFDVVNGHEYDGCFVLSGFGNKDAWPVVCHENKHNTIYVPYQNISIQLTRIFEWLVLILVDSILDANLSETDVFCKPI